MLTKEGEETAAWQAEKASFKATMQEYFDASSSDALDTAVDYDTEDLDYKWVQNTRHCTDGWNRSHSSCKAFRKMKARSIVVKMEAKIWRKQEESRPAYFWDGNHCFFWRSRPQWHGRKYYHRGSWRWLMILLLSKYLRQNQQNLISILAFPRRTNSWSNYQDY